MDDNRNNFFWPSYVDLMTALFAVVLVLFILSYLNFKNKVDELEGMVQIYKEDSQILNKVKANLKLFESDKEIFDMDTIYNRIRLRFSINFLTGYQYYKIIPSHIDSNYSITSVNLKQLGLKIKSIIELFKYQKENDTLMKDISYLMVVSGSASRFGDDYENYILSYRRAYSLYQFWKDTLNIDFDSEYYHDIIELQIAGTGIGGVGRFNDNPYYSQNKMEEKKNQRFIIYMTPKIGK